MADFGIDTGAAPDFLARATQLRRIHEEIERRAGTTYEDEAAANMAEAVTFMMAAALTAHEAGLPRAAFAALVESVAGDVWKAVRRG